MHKADNLPPSCAVFTKSAKLNFLEPSGPVQASNRTALPFFFSWDTNMYASFTDLIPKEGMIKGRNM